MAAPEAVDAGGLDPSDPVMKVAVYVDEALHGVSLDYRTYSMLLAELEEGAANGIFEALAVDALCLLSRRHGSIGSSAPARLGACPAVVHRALGLLRRENSTLHEIEKVVECDPILATSLLSFANSAIYARSAPVCSVASAIAYIGGDAAKRVILTASARPLFGCVTLPELWKHSVDVAAISEQLAAAAGMMDPSEAFVAGLIHDIGRIAIELTDHRELVTRHHRLSLASGCPILADLVFTGCEHGEIGANLLGAWHLPSALVDSVRYHHRPELHDSALASVVYLAEVVSGSVEDVPSTERIDCAMRSAGVRNLEWVTSDLRRLGTALAMCG
jgi:putative nucleotidyltransferase with HDIG domain